MGGSTVQKPVFCLFPGRTGRYFALSLPGRVRRGPADCKCMRQAVAILLLCSLSLHCAGRLGIVASWWLQRDYVARVLCINRDKPQLQCNGKCHLAKQLKAADLAEQKQQPVGGKHSFQEIQLFCPPAEGLDFAAPVAALAAPRYAGLRLPEYSHDQPGPDHPPCEG
jgi:hypothetical protein